MEEKARAWHVAISYHPLSSFTECEIVVFGGNKHYKGQTGARLAVSDTCILKFGMNYYYYIRGQSNNISKLYFLHRHHHLPAGVLVL